MTNEEIKAERRAYVLPMIAAWIQSNPQASRKGMRGEVASLAGLGFFTRDEADNIITIALGGPVAQKKD